MTANSTRGSKHSVMCTRVWAIVLLLWPVDDVFFIDFPLRANSAFGEATSSFFLNSSSDCIWLLLVSYRVDISRFIKCEVQHYESLPQDALSIFLSALHHCISAQTNIAYQIRRILPTTTVIFVFLYFLWCYWSWKNIEKGRIYTHTHTHIRRFCAHVNFKTSYAQACAYIIKNVF